MPTRELGVLETVPLSQVFTHEAHDFTPWLVKEENIALLAKAVNMENLEPLRREHWMPGSGFVDILAYDTKSKYNVVIENQLGPGDNSHFVRLISYAANSEAKILIWVASDFGKYYQDMLNWLNMQGVSVFAVKVAVYRINENYAPWFEVVVSPDDETNLVDPGISGQPNIYGRFYRPLTAELRREGILAIGGRQGGWSGRWRTYRAGTRLDDAGINFLTTLGLKDEKCSAGIIFRNGRNVDIDKAVLAQRNELMASIGDLNVKWGDPDTDKQSIVWAETEPLVDEEETTMQDTRQWMKDALLRFHRNLCPQLEEIIRGLE